MTDNVDKPKEPCYIFIDLETTGLDPRHGQILELGWVATDKRGETLHLNNTLAAITHIPEVNDYVFEMHKNSGLWGDLLKNAQDCRQGREYTAISDGLTELALWVSNHQDEYEFFWAGYSVHFDIDWLRAKHETQFERLNSAFSHRRMDLSVIKMFAKTHGPVIENPPVPAHRAIADCVEAIQTLKYANHIFEQFFAA